MARSSNPVPTIVGDVAVESVTVNDKGGSLSAILKRPLRADFAGGGLFYGARIDFEPGISCVLVAPGRTEAKDRTGKGRKFRVQRVTSHRYVLDFGDDDDREVVDPVTKATLKILEEMARTGRLTLLSQEAADKRFAKLKELEAEGDRLAAAAMPEAQKLYPE
jgi:hypothetical protein